MSAVFPRMIPVRQVFPSTKPIDIPKAVAEGFSHAAIRSAIKPGARIAIGVGSRGITNLQATVQSVVKQLQQFGASPFIIPAMGSHGGATPEGQAGILAEYGITEAAMGVPIRPSLEVQVIGRTQEGSDVFCSVEALQSDGVVLINRIKPHTDFTGKMGSGIMKMLVIGLGKRAGAAAFHLSVAKSDYETMLRGASRVICAHAPIIAGVGLVENQFHQTARLEIIPGDQIEARENELFQESRQLMPKLPFEEIDLLIVDRIGKNISGAGMDPNIIGRGMRTYSNSKASIVEKPVIQRIFVRDLTSETHGNGIGIGFADITTTRLVNGLDKQSTYVNALTSLSTGSPKIPIHFDTDREVLTQILPTLTEQDPAMARVVRITSTLDLEYLEVSEGFAAELKGRPDLTAQGSAQDMSFDEAGNLHAIRGAHKIA